MGSWSYDLKVLSNCVHKKPYFKLKLRTQPANSPFELRTVMSPWKPFFLAEKCHRLRVNKIQLKCAEGGDMQDPVSHPVSQPVPQSVLQFIPQP